jgi:hypothetical protein
VKWLATARDPLFFAVRESWSKKGLAASAISKQAGSPLAFIVACQQFQAALSIGCLNLRKFRH